jgi:3-deoxy-D-manno-octulosonate 8-phosphate phosphatase (KDO 8-P phosphatase)
MQYGKSSTGVDSLLPDFKVILIDCDGVLTDGRLTIDHRGEKPFKQFHTRDVRAIRELIYHGYEVVIVSADDWPGIHHFANKVGADVWISRDKSQLPYDNFVAIGDDAWDVPMLIKAKKAFCPADADLSALSVPGIQRLATQGGAGIIAELAREILK